MGWHEEDAPTARVGGGVHNETPVLGFAGLASGHSRHATIVVRHRKRVRDLVASPRTSLGDTTRGILPVQEMGVKAALHEPLEVGAGGDDWAGHGAGGGAAPLQKMAGSRQSEDGEREGAMPVAVRPHPPAPSPKGEGEQEACPET